MSVADGNPFALNADVALDVEDAREPIFFETSANAGTAAQFFAIGGNDGFAKKVSFESREVGGVFRSSAFFLFLGNSAGKGGASNGADGTELGKL